MKISIVFISVSLFLLTCNSNKLEFIEKSKKEIVATEREFAEFCKKEGMEAAFVKYADDSAVIHRNDKILKGKEAIGIFYKARPLKNTTLDWWPDFVDASSSGDLGYTYGHYVYASKDSTGKITENKGIFHTVWKKQRSGTWRFVWD
jgi:ketosteroid isomerase-like protein